AGRACRHRSRPARRCGRSLRDRARGRGRLRKIPRSMKVVYTGEALNDLAAIADWLTLHYPRVAPLVERRIRRVVAHIARWPASARRTSSRPGVHVVPLGRYPYKIFYRVTNDTVEILHIHHAARQPWDESP